MFALPIPPHVRGVIFDLDDTLIDLESVKLAAIEALAAVGVEVSRFRSVDHHWWSAYASGATSLDETCFGRWRDLGVSDDRLNEIEGLYRSHTEWPTAKNGVLDTMRSLRASGLIIGILSNGVAASQHAKIRVSGLSALVDAVVISDDIGVTKPDARAFLRAADSLGLEPSECAMVGDNLYSDCESALSAGFGGAYWVPRDIEQSGTCTSSNVVRLTTIADLPSKLAVVT